MPRVYQTALWRLQVPDAWTGEVRGEHGAFFRRDGVGLLQVHGADTVGRPDLLAYARDHSPPGTTFTEASCGRLRGIAGVLIDRSTLWRTWWLLCRGQLVFAAYQCATKNSQDDSDDLDQILQSFDESDTRGASEIDERNDRPDIYEYFGTYSNADTRLLLDAFVSGNIDYTLYLNERGIQDMPTIQAASGGTFGRGVGIAIGVHVDDWDEATKIRQRVLKIVP